MSFDFSVVTSLLPFFMVNAMFFGITILPYGEFLELMTILKAMDSFAQRFACADSSGFFEIPSWILC